MTRRDPITITLPGMTTDEADRLGEIANTLLNAIWDTHGDDLAERYRDDLADLAEEDIDDPFNGGVPW